MSISPQPNGKERAMYCAIIGDMIRSKELEPAAREAATAAIKDTLNYINTKYMDTIFASFGLVKGDAFEGVLFSQEQAPKIIQEIVKSLYRANKTKVRISVARDTLTVVSSDSNEADGPAFHTAAQKMEDLKKSKSEHWLQIAFSTNTTAQPVIDSVTRLLAALTEDWTDRQRETVWAMEEHSEMQNLVSKKLNVSPSVVNKHLKAAHYETYRQAWLDLESFFMGVEEEAVTYTAYYTVGMRKGKQRNFAEAISFLQKSLEGGEKELGENNPELSKVYDELAEAYLHERMNHQAKPLIEKSLSLQTSLPKARLEYAVTLRLMGFFYSNLSQHQKALPYLLEAKEITERTVGKDHPFLYACHNGIAICYKNMNEFEKALQEYFIALAYHRRDPNQEPLDMATLLCNISVSYEQNGSLLEAIQYAQEALGILKEYLPPKHREIIFCEDLLQRLRQCQKERSSAP